MGKGRKDYESLVVLFVAGLLIGAGIVSYLERPKYLKAHERKAEKMAQQLDSLKAYIAERDSVWAIGKAERDTTRGKRDLTLDTAGRTVEEIKELTNTTTTEDDEKDAEKWLRQQ